MYPQYPQYVFSSRVINLFFVSNYEGDHMNVKDIYTYVKP
jgi:hypothetical protein